MFWNFNSFEIKVVNIFKLLKIFLQQDTCTFCVTSLTTYLPLKLHPKLLKVPCWTYWQRSIHFSSRIRPKCQTIQVGIIFPDMQYALKEVCRQMKVFDAERKWMFLLFYIKQFIAFPFSGLHPLCSKFL